MNYTETKKQLDAIRSKYSCAGDIIFRTAIQYVVEHGQYNFRNESWFNDCITHVDKRHDLADSQGKILFMTRDFEKALLECARELANITAYNLLTYIQREVWLGGDGISYQRAIELCKNAIGWMADDVYDTGEFINDIRDMDFSDDEIDELGFGWMLDVEDDCEED